MWPAAVNQVIIRTGLTGGVKHRCVPGFCGMQFISYCKDCSDYNATLFSRKTYFRSFAVRRS